MLAILLVLLALAAGCLSSGFGAYIVTTFSALCIAYVATHPRVRARILKMMPIGLAKATHPLWAKDTALHIELVSLHTMQNTPRPDAPTGDNGPLGHQLDQMCKTNDVFPELMRLLAVAMVTNPPSLEQEIPLQSNAHTEVPVAARIVGEPTFQEPNVTVHALAEKVPGSCMQMAIDELVAHLLAGTVVASPACSRTSEGVIHMVFLNFWVADTDKLPPPLWGYLYESAQTRYVTETPQPYRANPSSPHYVMARIMTTVLNGGEWYSPAWKPGLPPPNVKSFLKTFEQTKRDAMCVIRYK